MVSPTVQDACDHCSLDGLHTPLRRHWSIIVLRKKGRGTGRIVAPQFLDEFWGARPGGRGADET
jgi:hypothetical protein